MLIQSTKKLLDELKIKPDTPAEEDPLFSWHANLIKVDRKKVVVIVNDKNRYIIVLHGLRAKDFKRLDEHILQAIRETFQQEGIKDDIIEKFINHSQKVTYAKTKNRSLVARMNKACENFHYYYEELWDNESIYKSVLSTKASRSLVSSGKDEYIEPNEEMYKDLEKFAGGPIFGSKAVELKVTLDLENHHVWRRIVVPANITFNKLHQVLQLAFEWQGYHLHQYYIYEEKTSGKGGSINHSVDSKKDYNTVINLVCDEEAFDYDNDVPMKLEVGVKLSEYIPSKIEYVYDFGDNWQHYIEIERVIDDYVVNYPVCLEGEGNSPPEDVGGEYGYEEFLKIIADKKHSEHEDMVNWGRMQDYKDFDIEKINKQLKHI